MSEPYPGAPGPQPDPQCGPSTWATTCEVAVGGDRLFALAGDELVAPG